MRKILSIVFALLGVGTIIFGVLLQTNSNNDEKNKKEEPIKKEDLTLKSVNSYNLKDTCTTYSKVPSYIYFTDFTKVSFNYPDCVHEYDLNFWSRYLKSEKTLKTSITVTREKGVPTTLLNQYKTRLIGWKNEEMYDEIEYSEISEFSLKNGLKAYAFQYNYKSKFIYETAYSQWYIIVQIKDDANIMFDIATKECIMSQSTIIDMLNSIEVSKVETIINSKLEGDYQIGTIKQNLYENYNHGYELTYKINKKYPEIDSTTTNINGSAFGYEDVSESVTVFYEVENSYRTTLEEAQGFRNVSKEKEDDTRKNVVNTELIHKEINNKKIIYFITSYDYYSNNKKGSSYATAYVYHEIAPNFYLKMYISNRNHEINDAFISEFLNFTVKEY